MSAPVLNDSAVIAPRCVEVTVTLPERMDGEPETEVMDEVVACVVTVVGQMPRLTIPSTEYHALSLDRRRGIELKHKLDILQRVSVRMDERSDAELCHYSLFVFASFRWKVGLKSLDWLGPLTGAADSQLRLLAGRAGKLHEVRQASFQRHFKK